MTNVQYSNTLILLDHNYGPFAFMSNVPVVSVII